MNDIWTIADIHGRLDLLIQLLDKLNTEGLDLSKNKLIFLGDYLDRGDNSKGVLDKVKELLDKHPNNVKALRGNHEDMAIQASINYNSDWYYNWLLNGGDKTLLSFSPLCKVLPDEYVKFLNSLPYKHEEPGFFFSHAPLPSLGTRTFWNRHKTPVEIPWTSEELTWTRTRNVWEEEYNTYKFKDQNIVGVCGHNHALNYKPYLQVPRLYKHYIFADAGCGCAPDAPLVAIEVNTRKVLYSYDPKYEPSTYGCF